MRARGSALLLAALAVGGGIAGCGGGSGSGGAGTGSGSGSGSGTATTSGRSTGSTTTARHSTTHRGGGARPPAVHGPPVGARQGVHIDGTYLTVTILRLVALRHSGSPTLPGTRQVGVELRIANQAGTTYDSTSSGDVSLVLSSGASEPLDVRTGTCETPLVDFESIVSAGSVRSGCVAFTVPRHARVTGVRFSPHSRRPGTLTWRVR